jgi:AbrB family looped-hinge helix DNA binding protein
LLGSICLGAIGRDLCHAVENGIEKCHLSCHYDIVTAKITLGAAGRLVIPKAVRDRLRLGAGDTLELESDGGKIVLRPAPAVGTMRKEKGMWVFYGGSSKAVTQIDTNALIEEDREARHRQILGEE